MSKLEKDCECTSATAEAEEGTITSTPEPEPKPKTVALSVYDGRKGPLATLPDGRLVVGALEKVKLVEYDLTLDARIDSGANTSSLDARDVVEFERDGKKWVRFYMRGDVEKTTPIERPILKVVRVSQTNSPVPDRRPVVQMQLQVGPETDLIDFNLTNRAEMTYPVLLGRRFLIDRAVIDVAHNYIQDLP